jgi:hypothetical protein
MDSRMNKMLSLKIAHLPILQTSCYYSRPSYAKLEPQSACVKLRGVVDRLGHSC